MKIVRVMVVCKAIAREARLFMRPSAAIQIKLGKRPVEQEYVVHILSFVALFLLVFGLCSFLMTFYTPNLETAATAVIASLGNIGPGLSAVGATQNYAAIPAAGQAILIGCMLLGRLELYTVLVLFYPGFWKR